VTVDPTCSTSLSYDLEGASFGVSPPHLSIHMKHDPLEKLRTIVTFLLLDLPERDLIHKAISRLIVFLGVLAWIAFSIYIFK
jgi:hypothetical protein